MELRQVRRNSSQNQTVFTTRSAYYTIKWAPDLDYLPSRSVRGLTIISVSEFIQYLHYKQPQIAILEIGAIAAPSLGHTLSEYLHEIISPSDFTFTCADNNELQILQETVKTRKHKIRYKTLDIHQNALEQGFQASSFDLVIAPQICANSTFNKEIINVRRLLRSGGRLLLSGNSAVSEKDHAKVLSENGFSDVGLQLEDQDSNVIISSRVTEANSPSLLPSVKIITSDGSDVFAQDLRLAMQQIGLRASLDPWPSGSPCPKDIYVVVDDMECLMLLNPAKDRFGQIVRFLVEQCSIV